MSGRLLILPGYGNSGPDHWQTHLEREFPGCRRLSVPDWEKPEESTWVKALQRELAASPASVLVAHSLACLLVDGWASRESCGVAGALLVAPPNPMSPAFPSSIRGFRSPSSGRLPFKTIVVGSADDPYSTWAYTEGFAARVGADLINLGQAGHINAASGYGRWPLASRLVQSLLA